MLHKLVSLLVVIALVCTSLPCLADPTPPVVLYTPPIITPLTKGQPAPFSGVLLTPEAVAKVIAEAQDCPKRIKVEADHARDVQKAEDDKVLADAKADAEHDKKILQAGITSRDGQIKDLTTALQKSEDARKNTWLWVGGGTLVGVLVTIGTVVLVSSAK
jgi:sensor c-di-GMP phosphodiesterase-like protein